MRTLNLIQYVGGKGTQLADLLPLIPYTRGYVEPFGGGGSILLNRRPVALEVYNDLNDDVVNLFRVMRDPDLYADLADRLELTHYSRGELREALAILSESGGSRVERAWAFYVVQNQGMSGIHIKSESGWARAQADNLTVRKWWRRHERLPLLHERLKSVQIDSQDALDCIRYWDAPDVTFYVDPPYVLTTREDREYYRYEMTDEDHGRLVECLLGTVGPVVLSGYDHPVYDPLVDAGWEVRRYGAYAYARPVGPGEQKSARVEVVWRNPAAQSFDAQARLF